MNMRRMLCTGVVSCAFAVSSLVAAEGEFAKVWESQFGNSADFVAQSNTDASFILGATDKVFEVLNGADGKKVDGGDYNTLCGFKKPNSGYCVADANQYIVINLRRGNDPDDMVSFDMTTGKMLWKNSGLEDIDVSSVRYIPEVKAFAVPVKDAVSLVDAASGKILWTKQKFFGNLQRYSYLPDKKMLVTISYVTGGGAGFGGLGAAFTLGRTQLSCMNVETGAAVWDTVFPVVNSTMMSKESQKDNVGLSIEGDKVYARLDGLKVFDLATGKGLWTAEIPKDNWGRKVLHAMQLPKVIGDAVYMTNLSKQVEKYNLSDGSKAWEVKLDKADYMPVVQLIDGKLIVQRGGYICKETEMYTTIGSTRIFVGYKYDWEMDGPYGLTALDAATGKQLWLSEKFKNGITNLVAGEGCVYIASGQSYYCIATADGSSKYVVDHKAQKLGEPLFTLDNGDNVVVISEKGLNSYAKADGKLGWRIDLKDVKDYFTYGKNFFIRAKDGDLIVSVDLTAGKIKGQLEVKKWDKYTITDDGEFVVTFKGKKVAKFKVNG